ncbi:MAG: sodium/proton-translocating pyrophosphatase, partial [Nitrososphaerota archaeon]|nr:sodium/proton-translocating pyrophosphatase [Nitrososphaerota archaeon]
GLFIGAVLPFFFTSFLMNAVGVAAEKMVFEIRRQFREIPGILAGTAKPDYGTCVDIVTLTALQQLAVPAIIAVATPLAVGFLGGFAATRRDLRTLWKEFDVRSLLILYAFIASVTVAAYALAGYIAPYVAPAALGEEPYSGVFIGVLSNLMSNVPVTQLLVNTTGVSAHVAPKIAVEAGLAGNLGPVASFANLLALRMAAKEGLSVKKAVGLQVLVGLVAYIPALL